MSGQVDWTSERGQDGCFQVRVNGLGYSVVRHTFRTVRGEAATNSQKVTIRAVLLVFRGKGI